MLLHLCQPIELGSKELRRTKPNEGVMYVGRFFFPPLYFSLSLACKGLHFEDSRSWCSVK